MLARALAADRQQARAALRDQGHGAVRAVDASVLAWCAPPRYPWRRFHAAQICMSIESQHPNGEPATSSADTRANARRSSTAQISSAVALAISLLALAMGAYQTRLMQAQARASVWPIVSLGLSYFGNRDNGGFTWEVENNGVGPALIKSVTLSLDG